MTLTEEIHKHLRSLGIEFREMSHAPATTSLDSAMARGVDPSSGAKAMLVKNKETFSIFVIPGDRRMDWKSVKSALGSKSARLASEDELLEVTGLVKGSLPPFGNLLGLTVFIDEDVTAQPLIRFNAGSLTESVEMPGPDLVRATDGTVGFYAE